MRREQALPLVFGFAQPNKRVNLTNHGLDSKLRPDACVAVVCRLRAVR
jgi:hypothetical protein